jgi:hypothetical protein
MGALRTVFLNLGYIIIISYIYKNIIMNTKICSHCNIEKSLEEFHAGTGKMNKRSQCKSCCKLLYDTPERLLKNIQKRAERRKNDPSYKQKEKDLAKLNNKNNPLKYLIKLAKIRAKNKNLEFLITENDLILPVLCPLLNITLQINEQKSNYNSYSLDRIDNSKGYIPGNVWVISHRANFLKNNASIEELELLVKNLKNRQH